MAIDHSAAEQDYLSGMKYREIAEKYGVSLNTVKSWKQRFGWSKKGAHASKKVCTQKKSAPCAPPPLPEPDVALTDKELLFCQIYVQNFNATQAARKAGYSPHTAYSIGHEILRKPKMQAYITRLKEAKRASIMIDVDDIVERYMRIAFSDITDFVEFGRALVPVMTAFGPLEATNPDTGEKEQVMREVNDVRFKESAFVDGGLVSQVKLGRDGASIKLEDRMKALDWLSHFFEANPQDRHKRDYDKARLAIAERAVEVQESKLKGVSDDIDAINERIEDIAKLLNSPVPNRKVQDYEE